MFKMPSAGQNVNVVRLPLHLDPNDTSQSAVVRRIELLQYMHALTGGIGFRWPPSSDKKTATQGNRGLGRLEKQAQKAFGQDEPKEKAPPKRRLKILAGPRRHSDKGYKSPMFA
jgi:hypothetical protein